MIQFFAVVLPALILFCGLSIDVGLLELRKLQMQSAADAAALGAELEAERGTGDWQTIGQQEASINGFTDGSNNTTVTLIQRSNFGAYNGRWDTLQATITQSVHTIFMGALNGGVFTLTAQSSALVTPCVYLLGTGALQPYNLENVTGSLDGNSCPIYAKNNIDVTASGHIAVEAMNVSGSSGTSAVSGFMFPSPNYGVPTVTDPLASLTQPSLVTSSGQCTYTGKNVTSGIVTLNPGVYCKGLNISNATVNLSPGLYTITGGATWQNATVNGTGVTLFFTQGGGAGYGQFLIQYSKGTLSAPTDNSNGGTPGVLVFADRNWVHTGAQDFLLNGSYPLLFDGIWYIKGAGLSMWSCGTVTGTNYFGVVADNLYIGGSIFTPLNNYSYVTTGNPFRKAAALVQ
jgi:Flp pilus assembly protein TadG